MLPHSCNCSGIVCPRKQTPTLSRTNAPSIDMLGRVVRRVKWEEKGQSQTGVTDSGCMPEGHNKIQGKLSGMEMWEHVMRFVFAKKGSPLLPMAQLVCLYVLGSELSLGCQMMGWQRGSWSHSWRTSLGRRPHVTTLISYPWNSLQPSQSIRPREAPVCIQSQTKLLISAAAIQLPCFWLSSLCIAPPQIHTAIIRL